MVWRRAAGRQCGSMNGITFRCRRPARTAAGCCNRRVWPPRCRKSCRSRACSSVSSRWRLAPAGRAGAGCKAGIGCRAPMRSGRPGCNWARSWWLGRSSSTSNWGCRSARWRRCCDSTTASRSAVADWSAPSSGPAGTRSRPMRPCGTRSATVRRHARRNRLEGRRPAQLVVGGGNPRDDRLPDPARPRLSGGRQSARHRLRRRARPRDGWAPYRRFTAATHQNCLAHLLRRAKTLRTDHPYSHVVVEIQTVLQQALGLRDELRAGTRSPALGGRVKSGHLWTPQIRPFRASRDGT